MFTKRLRLEIAQWAEKGLLSPELAALLLEDVNKRRRGIGVAQVLTILAAVFLSVALLLVVSANWEVIPRIVRLGTLAALIWIFHVGGALFMRSGREVMAAACLILGTVAFGGGLSLVAQMYHISGDLVSMFTVWFAAAAVTSVLFRSGAVGVVAGGLALALCGALLDENGASYSLQNLLYPLVLAAIMGVLARLSGQEKVAHFSFLMLLGWAIWLYGLDDGVPMAIVMAVTGFALFFVLSFSGSPLRVVGQMVDGAAQVYSLLLSAIGLFLLHVSLGGQELILAAVAGILVAIAALALVGNEHGGVRWLSYAMLAAIIYYVAFETVGTILGTSGFFLLAATVAGILAFAVVRLERRLARSRREVA